MTQNDTKNVSASRLRAVIDARGQSLRAFSDQTGIKYRSLQEYVAGNSMPGYEQLQKMSEAGVDIMYLLTGVYSSGIVKSLSPETATSQLLSSDKEVMDMLRERLIEIVDTTNAENVAAEGTSMPLKTLMFIFQYGMTCALEMVAKMEDNLIGLRQAGVSAKAVTDIIMDTVYKLILTKIEEGKL